MRLYKGTRRQVCAYLIVLLLPMIASADDWGTFVDGRFPHGPVTVVKLTKTQKALLSLIRRCSSGRPSENTRPPLISNEHTPYVFRLTREQSAILRKDAGFSPTRFVAFESYRGDDGADEDVNIINRFSENEFEIPHELLTHDGEARDWEVNTIGWLPNPLEKANPISIDPSSCPR